MHRSKYSPTKAPGDTRLRVWFVGISNALDQHGAAEVREEEVIRKSDGVEKSLGCTRDMSLAYSAELGQQIVQMLNPKDDAEIPGFTMTIDQIYCSIYTLSRYIQGIEDAKQVEK